MITERHRKSLIRANYHTHTTWCDGAHAPEAVILSAMAKGFETIGFSSHVAFPERILGMLDPDKGLEYAADIRRLQAKYADRIKVFLGVEADYIPGATAPERSRYAALNLDYMIGAIHYVVTDDGSRVPVDNLPRMTMEGIAVHFQGSAEAYIRAYFRQLREMVSRYEFEIVAHLDLVRKFNVQNPYFDEDAAWYREELEQTADVVAASGKIVEVNTGAISRGWLDDAYPSRPFRDLLRERGVRFLLSADAHAADTIDCAFDRFSLEERFLEMLP
jgi:histidinol-phosphatase (PHP family)